MIGLNRRRTMGNVGSAYPADAIMTVESNPEVLAICYAQGWCASDQYMTASEAAAVNSVGTVFKGNKTIKSFDEFQYFGVTSLASQAFRDCSLKSIVFPQNMVISAAMPFKNCTNLEYVELTSGFRATVSTRVFEDCTKLKKIKWNTLQTFDYGELSTNYLEELESDVYDVYDKCLYRGNTLILCPVAHVITFKPGITALGDYCLRNYKSTSLIIPSGVTYIGNGFMNYSAIKEIDFPSTVTTFGYSSMQRAIAMIHCKVRAITPPTLGRESTSYITAATANNPRYLHVPVGSTAYGSSSWNTQFVKNKGWTLVYDL